MSLDKMRQWAADLVGETPAQETPASGELAEVCTDAEAAQNGLKPVFKFTKSRRYYLTKAHFWKAVPTANDESVPRSALSRDYKHLKRNIIVPRLPLHVKPGDLVKLFGSYGKIITGNIVLDVSIRDSCSAYITFTRESSARTTFEMFAKNRATLWGMLIDVCEPIDDTYAHLRPSQPGFSYFVFDESVNNFLKCNDPEGYMKGNCEATTLLKP